MKSNKKRIGILISFFILTAIAISTQNISYLFADEVDNDNISRSTLQSKSLTSGDYTYDILSDGVVITNYNGNAKKLNLPSKIDGYKVTAIGQYAFNKCESIESIKIPSGVTRIGYKSFYKCYNLETIEIPNGVTSIEEYAFSECESLKSIKLPNSIIKIGEHAFWNCKSLKSAKLSNNIKKIERGTFHGCSSLEKIELPNGISEIGDSAFAFCDDLESIEIPNRDRTSSCRERV